MNLTFCSFYSSKKKGQSCTPLIIDNFLTNNTHTSKTEENWKIWKINKFVNCKVSVLGEKQ